MEVTILRHGETELNAQLKVQGSRVDPSLSDSRRNYAENAAKNVDFFDELSKKHATDKVLVVCHGVVSRMICAHYISNGNMAAFAQMGNCCSCKLYLSENSQSLAFYNRKYL